MDSQNGTTWLCMLLSELSRRHLLSFLLIHWRTYWHFYFTIDPNPPLLSFAGLTASLAMFNTSFRAVLHSPESFFDTNPNGKLNPFPLEGALSNMLRANIVPLVQGSRHSGYSTDFRHVASKYGGYTSDSNPDTCLVLIQLWVCSWDCGPCPLYIPITRAHIRPHGPLVLHHFRVLSTFVC